MNCYNIFLHGFFFFLIFFSKTIFIDFIFFSWLQILLCSFFFLINTVDCYKVFPYGFCFATLFPHIFFFQNYLCWFFFNIELVENLALTFLTCFSFHFFPKLSFSFFCVFFSRIVFVDFIFLIWSWLRI